MGYICRCFFERNIYLKDFDLHVNFFGNTTEFKRCYGEFLSQHGCSEEGLQDVIALVEKEVGQRKELHKKAAERKRLVVSQYKRLHPEIFSVKESYLDPQFIRIINYAKSAKATPNGLLGFPTLRKHAAPEVYILPVFTRAFCERLVEELENFNASDLPKGRPNTMNHHGILLEEIGLIENFIGPFVKQFIEPLTKILFPSYGEGSLDFCKAFTVKYKMGEDLNLGYHFDNAEVTLNVCIGKDFTEGNLYFGDTKQVPLKDSECSELVHRIGYGCLHRGEQMHGALPIHSGERHNLILWMRSSQVRNNCCPMCDRKPNLVEVPGMGDGFTVPTVPVCSTL